MATLNIFNNSNKWDKCDKIISLHKKRIIGEESLSKEWRDVNFITLNGIKTREIPLHYTCLSTQGKSTIDLAWSNFVFAETVNSFGIHPTLTICSVTTTDLSSGRVHLDRPTIKNKSHFNIKYQFEITPHIYFNDINSDNLYNNLISAIKQTASKVGMMRIH